MDLRAFGSWTSAPTCLIFQDFEGLSRLTEVFAPERPLGYPSGHPAPRLTLWAAFSFGDRDRGVKSPKIRGGVKILNFQGPLKLTSFYRDSIENRQFGGQKSKSSRGNFRGEFPPPLAFGTFLTPPIPVSDLFCDTLDVYPSDTASWALQLPPEVGRPLQST